VGVLVAMRRAESTGRGQLVDVGIYEAVFRVLEEMATAYGISGKIREREGAGSFVAVPHGHFRARDGKWIAIACTTDKMFERLSEAMGQPELSSSSLYGEQRKRLAARDLVNQIVIEWVGAHTRDEVMAHCLEHEVPAGAVNSIADIFQDPQFAARENLARFHETDIGEIVIPGVLPRLSATPGRITNLGPMLGDATDHVLQELLHVSASDISQLRSQRVV
jgi:succinyl-CoA:(S)-malate CoA-transferase subunit A